jgi:hypothetical protein
MTNQDNGSRRTGKPLNFLVHWSTLPSHQQIGSPRTPSAALTDVVCFLSHQAAVLSSAGRLARGERLASQRRSWRAMTREALKDELS